MAYKNVSHYKGVRKEKFHDAHKFQKLFQDICKFINNILTPKGPDMTPWVFLPFFISAQSVFTVAQRCSPLSGLAATEIEKAVTNQPPDTTP